MARSAPWQVAQRIERLAVVADLEVQHVAVGAGAAHLRDLLAGANAVALAHHALAVVAIGRQPLLVVLDDDQLAVADQARTRIHHHAVAGSVHRLPGRTRDADALARGIAVDIAADQLAVGGPAPSDRTACRRRAGRLRRSLRRLDGPATAVHYRARASAGAAAGRVGRAGAARAAAGSRRRIQPQRLPRVDRVRRLDAVPHRQVECADAVVHGKTVDGVAPAHGDRLARFGRRGPRTRRPALADHLARTAAGKR